MRIPDFLKIYAQNYCSVQRGSNGFPDLYLAFKKDLVAVRDHLRSSLLLDVWTYDPFERVAKNYKWLTKDNPLPFDTKEEIEEALDYLDYTIRAGIFPVYVRKYK